MALTSSMLVMAPSARTSRAMRRSLNIEVKCRANVRPESPRIGTTAIVRTVEAAESGQVHFQHLYELARPIAEKIETIATRIYRAEEVIADSKIRAQLHAWEEAGYGNLPVCMAKTQYSFSTDPNLKNAPSGHVVPIREVRLSNGAEFLVVICGEIMTMPGLPRVPAAHNIDVDSGGNITGLF